VLFPEFLSLIRTIPAVLLLRAFGVRVIMRLGNAPHHSNFYRRLFKWLLDPLVDMFACNSNFTRTELLECGVNPEKAAMIYNVAPARSANTSVTSSDVTRVVYVGQIIPDKGLDILLEAIALLLLDDVDVTLDIAGDLDGWVPPAYADFRAKVRRRAARVDLADRVRFLGYREDVPAILGSAAVHCMPSPPETREGFGIAVLEAKLAGVPSVVFNSGALGELVSHRVDGWVCEVVTAASLAEGLRYFLTDHNARLRSAAAARDSAAQFSRREFRRRWAALFGLTHPHEPADA
jgi:glycosyltransferase involved in cell wall biosynthesis